MDQTVAQGDLLVPEKSTVPIVMIHLSFKSNLSFSLNSHIKVGLPQL